MRLPKFYNAEVVPASIICQHTGVSARGGPSETIYAPYRCDWPPFLGATHILMHYYSAYLEIIAGFLACAWSPVPLKTSALARRTALPGVLATAPYSHTFLRLAPTKVLSYVGEPVRRNLLPRSQNMDKRLLDELSARLAGLMPAANELRQETRAKVEQTLKHGLKELDVLTREEFDAQARALGRAQQRVTELEALIADLESRLATLEQQQSQS